MSETVAPKKGALIVGLVLLLVGFTGLAAAGVGLLGIVTDDLSCTYSPRCGTYTLYLVLGVLVGVPGIFGGLVLVRHKRIEPALPPWQDAPRLPVPDSVPVMKPSIPGWALICGVIALAVSLLCGFLALNWLLAYLSNASNPFAGLGLILGLGAGVVAAGFLILGIMLLAKKQ